MCMYVHRFRMPHTPNLPTKTFPTKLACCKLSGKFPAWTGQIQTPECKILLESNPLKSRI